MFRVQNHKIKVFVTNANVYSVCKLKLNTTNLKGPVDSNSIKGTIATHSTIVNRQHRVFLTFLLSVALALLVLAHNTCHFGSNHLPIQAICEKTALEVLTHVHVLLKQYTGIEVNW